MKIGSIVTPTQNFEEYMTIYHRDWEIYVHLVPTPKLKDIAEVINVTEHGLELDTFKINIIKVLCSGRESDLRVPMYYNPEFWRELLPPAELNIEDLIQEPLQLVDDYV